MKKKTLAICAYIVSFIFLISLLLLLYFQGIFLLNNPSKEQYPVRGVDVSSYQGTIDWDTLSAQDVSFAFIKATEGSSYLDKQFKTNWKNAQKTGLRIGAYHFFSYDSAGITQAENFINNVSPCPDMLPPVIDLEFYGKYYATPAAKEDVVPQLNAMLTALEQHYKQKPIIYVTARSYELYLAGAYEEYDIWIRNVYGKPSLPDGKDWVFWQYADREKLSGYAGKEKFIDINVFCSTAEDFAHYGKAIGAIQ